VAEGAGAGAWDVDGEVGAGVVRCGVAVEVAAGAGWSSVPAAMAPYVLAPSTSTPVRRAQAVPADAGAGWKATTASDV
jgi:hypothetical protein